MLQITLFCVFMSCAGAVQKRRKYCKCQCCKYQCSWRQNTKNLVNYSMFGRLITKNAGIYTVFEMSRKRGHFWTLKCWYWRSFCPWQYQTAFFALLNRCFALMNAKNAGIYAFFKKSEIMTWAKPVKKQCFIYFRGLKLWYLRGFLPSDSEKCCKLQHFVRCLCSIFKRAMLSHVLGIFQQETTLQIETRRQCGPKESWREETRR